MTDFFRQQNFQPWVLSIFFHPFFFIRRDLSRNIRLLTPLLSGRLIDFGCGRKPFEKLFQVSEYIGLDIEETGHDHRHSKVDIYYDGKHIPFPDQSFDALFSSEVLEHVFNVEQIIAEWHRVLKPGGRCLVTIPFCWNEHEVPYDFARYTSFAVKDLFERNGFRIVVLKKSGHFARVVFQLWALYFYELFKKWRLAGYLLSLIFIIPINVLGSILLLILPKDESLYFNNIVVVEKIP